MSFGLRPPIPKLSSYREGIRCYNGFPYPPISLTEDLLSITQSLEDSAQAGNLNLILQSNRQSCQVPLIENTQQPAAALHSMSGTGRRALRRPQAHISHFPGRPQALADRVLLQTGVRTRWVSILFINQGRLPLSISYLCMDWAAIVVKHGQRITIQGSFGQGFGCPWSLG
jgi:hypothetical protein